MLTGGTQLLVTGLLILFALSIFIILIRNIYYSREADKVKGKGNEKNIKKVLIFILILILGLVLNRKFQWGSYLADSNNLKEITNFVHNNYILSVFYI